MRLRPRLHVPWHAAFPSSALARICHALGLVALLWLGVAWAMGVFG